MNAATSPLMSKGQARPTAARPTAARPTAARPTAARRAAARRAIAGPGAVLAAIGVAALTGCSAGAPPAPSAKPATTPAAAAGAATAPGTVATPAASVTTVAAAATTSPAPQASGAAPAALPVLGRLAGVFTQGQGFGQVKPAEIFNGGDPTGLVTKLTWSSWGGSQAVGSGMSDYVGPGQSVATGTQKPVTVVAFKLGTCHGTLMYKAVEWYFPKEGQAFSPGQYENICSGRYVPGS
jgi:hypothetical protein